MLRVSCYGFTPATYKTVHGVDKFKLGCENLNRLIQARNQAAHPFEIHVIIISAKVWKDLSEKGLRIRDTFIGWLQSEGIFLNDVFVPHNFGGGREYNKAADKGLCSIVWGARKEILQVTWDLKVIPCCFDFNSTVIFGDLRPQSLEEIFSSDAYLKFILAHQNDVLTDYPVCLGCERCFEKTVPS